MEKPDVQVPVRSVKSVLVRGQDEGSALTGEIHRKLQRNELILKGERLNPLLPKPSLFSTCNELLV